MSPPGAGNIDDRHNDGPSYEKRSDAGSQSAAGTNYELFLHGVVALLAFSNNMSGEQTYEESGLGCLDDLCFKYEEVEGGGRNLILIQAKHSTNAKPINEEDIKSAYGSQRDTFSLAKYFMAFLEAKKTAKAEGDRVQRIVLFTNRALADGLLPHLIEQKIEDIEPPLQMLLTFPGFDGALFYKIKDTLCCDLVAVASGKSEKKNRSYCDKLLKGWEKENVLLDALKVEFLDKFVFAACQPNVEELQYIERHVFAGLPCCESMSSEEKKLVFNFFNSSVKQWMHERDRRVSSWTSKRSGKCLTDAKAELSCLKIKGLSEANFLHLERGVSIQVNMLSPRFPKELHIFETQQLTVDARLAACTGDRAQSDCRLLRAEELSAGLHDGLAVMKDVRIVIVHDSEKRPTVTDIMNRILNYDSLTTIILTNQQSVGTPLKKIQASDLSEETLDKIMTETISFKGQSLMIRDVIEGYRELRSILGPNDVELLSSGSKLAFGRIVESPQEPYIVRHLDEIQDLSVEPDTGEEARNGRPNLIEEKIIEKAMKENKHVIVSAPPGFGKSSLASSMCGRLQKQHPAWWIGKCDLKEKMTALGKYKEKLRNVRGEQSITGCGLTQLEYDLLWELLNVEDMEKRLIEGRLIGNGRVVLIIDSYDEIEYMYGSVFQPFIRSLAKLRLCVCLTTREHVMQQAQSVLMGHLAFRLKRLTPNEQIDLLSRLWLRRLKWETSQDPLERLVTEAEELLSKLPSEFCANPLHLFMISETINVSNSTHSMEKNEITLYSMYHNFVQIKFDCYWREAKFDPRVEAEKNNKLMKDDHTQIAIWHLLGESHKWNSNEERAHLLKRVQEKNVGIVSGKDEGHPSFVHESYAEYFLSLHVYDASKKLLYLGDISDIMVSRRFYQVRRFIDGILKSDKSRIPFTVPLEQSTKQLLPDSFLLNPVKERLLTLSLHLWQFRHYFSDDIQQEVFFHAVEKCLQPFVEQAILDGINVNKAVDGRRVLEYGLDGNESQQVLILRKLFDEGYQLLTTSEDGVSVLHSIIKKGTYVSVVDLLIKRGCEVSATTKSGETLLHAAAKAGRTAVVELLIEKQCNVDATTKSGETALHSAVVHKNNDVVTLLLDKGCDVNITTKSGRTALHKAAHVGNIDVVRHLVKAGCNVNAVAVNGETALHVAAKSAKLDVVELLIKQGCDVHAATRSNETALYTAASLGLRSVVDLLIEKGCDVNAASKTGETVLHKAAARGNINVVNLLLEKGCRVDAVTKKRETVLHKAAESGSAAAVRLFIDKGCDLNAPTTSGETALLKAALRGKVNVINVLLEKGSEVNAVTLKRETVLHKAAESGIVEVVELFMANGCDGSATTTSGETALHTAVISRKDDVVKLLVEKGCDVNAATKSGETALHMAVVRRNMNVVRLLCEKGCEVSAVTVKGHNALHMAVLYPNTDVVEQLLEAGCEVNAMTKSGKTVLHKAAKSGSLALVELLIEKGCDANAKTKSGETVLHKAAESGSIGVVERFIEKGCNGVKAVTKKRVTVLHKAAASGNVGVVNIFIKKGCDVNAATKSGKTVLHTAAARGNINVINKLLEKGAEVQAVTVNGASVLHMAAMAGSIDVVTLLIERGCSVHALTKGGETVLHAAARSGCIATVGLLIEKGCDVNAATKTGETMLHKAAESDSKDVVELFIKKGCDVNASTKGGETVLHKGAARGNINVVALLLKRGCDLNAVTVTGETVLHKGAQSGSKAVVKLLVQQGCDVNAVTRKGETVIGKAACRGNQDVVNLLESHTLPEQR